MDVNRYDPKSVIIANQAGRYAPLGEAHLLHGCINKYMDFHFLFEFKLVIAGETAAQPQ